MSEKKANQKIEDGIAEKLGGDAQKSALGFIAYLRSKKVSLLQTHPDTWRANYKGKSVCRIILKNDNSWLFKPNDDFRDGYAKILDDDRTRKTALDNIYVKPCLECSEKCSGGVNAAILGKEYEKICKHFYIHFSMPDAEAVECAKKIVEIRCDDIAAV